MDDADDFELIRRYAKDGSETAFAELVRRHIGLVYASALRQMHDPHDAEDVTQAVFILLARNAGKLGRKQVKPVLGGWLVTTTRYVASNARRSASRRRSHERRAAELAAGLAAGQANATNRAGNDPMSDANKPNETSQGADKSEWQRIAPELDEALAELSPRARDAVVLRYFQGKSVRETAAALGVTEEAAKRRLSRALGQLRALFGRRGITVSAFALAGLLSAHAVQAVPSALVAATTAVSLESVAAVGASHAAALAAKKGTATLMSLIKSKVAIALTLLTVGGTTAAVAFRALAGPPGGAARPGAPGGMLLAAAPQATPGAGPPGAPAGGGGAAGAQKDDAWRKRFDEVYRLDDGQALRHVTPPFILERAAYINSIGNIIDPAADGLVVFAWRDGYAEFDSWALGASTVGSVLGSTIGLPSYKLEMKLKDRLRPWPGDWVIRKDAPEDKKMEALGKVLHDELKWKVHFEKREAEHDVIVVTGSFAAPKANPDGMVDVFIDARHQNNSAAGDLPRFLSVLGELCNTEPIDEATGPAKGGCFWHVHTGTNLGREEADKLLANVSAQTGLHFARARRVTSHWVTVRDEKPEK